MKRIVPLLLVIFLVGCGNDKLQGNKVETISEAEYLHEIASELELPELDIPNLQSYEDEYDVNFISNVTMYLSRNHIQTVTSYEAMCIKCVCDEVGCELSDVVGWEVLISEEDIFTGTFVMYYNDSSATGTIQLNETFYTDMCAEIFGE